MTKLSNSSKSSKSSKSSRIFLSERVSAFRDFEIVDQEVRRRKLIVSATCSRCGKRITADSIATFIKHEHICAAGDL